MTQEIEYQEYEVSSGSYSENLEAASVEDLHAFVAQKYRQPVWIRNKTKNGRPYFFVPMKP